MRNRYVPIFINGGGGSGPQPQGKLEIEINENGVTTENVAQYAEVEITTDVQPTLENVNVQPTKEQQTITPSEDFDGIGEVVVEAVQSDIDENIKAENIKKDVEILGVVGTLESMTPQGTKTLTRNGIYNIAEYEFADVQAVHGDFDYLYMQAITEVVTISFTEQNSDGIQLFYSKNTKDNWEEWDFSNIVLQPNEVVWFYGVNDRIGTVTSESEFEKNSHFNVNGIVRLGGNINSLLSQDGSRTVLPNACFSGLFNNCHIYDASGLKLPSLKIGAYAYCAMFRNNLLLDSAGFDLPATYCGADAYARMFESCENLVQGPREMADVDKTSLDYLYYYMFYNCQRLLYAPIIKITNGGNHTFMHMFNNCKSLVNAPILNIETVGDSCCKFMFQDCENLQLSNDFILKPTQLATYCYNSMFAGCKSITTLNENMLMGEGSFPDFCCWCMFANCTNLTTTPIIKATSVAQQSLANMFENCPNVNEITLHVLATEKYNQFDNWVNGVANVGTMYKSALLTLPIGASGIPNGWTVVDLPTFTEVDGTIEFSTTIENATIYYKIGIDGEYVEYVNPIAISDLGSEADVYAYADNGTIRTKEVKYPYMDMFYIEALTDSVFNTEGLRPSFSWSPVLTQYSRNKVVWTDIGSGVRTIDILQGERLYLRPVTFDGSFNKTLKMNSGTIKCGGCFSYLAFGNCRDDNQCNSTSSFSNVFNGCSALVDVSDLKLNLNLNYGQPSGPTLEGFFKNCVNLVEPTNHFPFSVVRSAFKEMYRGCTSLTHTPIIPQYDYLYSNIMNYMFADCTALTDVCDLYCGPSESPIMQNMFKSCTSLRKMPKMYNIDITSSYGYSEMFYGCTNLVETEPLILNGDNFGSGPFQHMFRECKNLEESPTITINVENWSADRKGLFERMFMNCSKLRKITVYGNWAPRNYNTTYQWVQGVQTNSGEFYTPSNVSWSQDVNGIPVNWTRIDND